MWTTHFVARMCGWATQSLRQLDTANLSSGDFKVGIAWRSLSRPDSTVFTRWPPPPPPSLFDIECLAGHTGQHDKCRFNQRWI